MNKLLRIGSFENLSFFSLAILIYFFKKSIFCFIPIRGRSQTTFTKFGFFDHLPLSVYIFYGMKVYKKSIFLTTYPPPLVNIVCERPLRSARMFPYTQKVVFFSFRSRIFGFGFLFFAICVFK